MEYNKLIEKTNNIITWLDVNDVGSMDTVLRGLITSAQVEGQTEKQYEQFWSSIRSLCGTLPNSPIRKGTQPTFGRCGFCCESGSKCFCGYW